MKPVAFFSSALNPAQRKNSVGEREAWTLVVAALKFRKYLQAVVEVFICSDHNPWEWLSNQRDPSGNNSDRILSSNIETIRYGIGKARITSQSND